ncbi:hypothetical protein Slin15195_G037150 [Septoria linicola]|uniref:Uncharacterized protein n=1 Tax=Septoria linicola TaxID=215465 RepID=A0A9Q9ATD3_9PEZI|nr:hypothetical protein Slin14017_G118560 [Septoria linicola]USW50396.1 hypothetical protein Slin15195_G037150 [Septoria linicola]
MDSIRNIDFLNLSNNERIVVEMHPGQEPFPPKSYVHLGEGKFLQKDQDGELEIVGEVSRSEMRKLLNVYDERTELAKIDLGGEKWDGR